MNKDIILKKLNTKILDSKKDISLKELNIILEEINEEINIKKNFKKYMKLELKYKKMKKDEKEKLIEFLWENQFDIMDGKIFI